MELDYVALGRAGPLVSVMGLGCGGRSRLGLRRGTTEQESVGLVRRALGLGINLFDTAESYGTERILGQALRHEPRETIVISTKKSSMNNGRPVSAADIRPALEASLRRLGLDYVDIYHVHGLAPRHYDYAVNELVPELLALRDEGKLRLLGVTEPFSRDPRHEMLRRAVQDGCWDVVMVGFNILNQSAREHVLAATRKKGIGTLAMFALRRALSDLAHLRAALADLRKRRLIDARLLGQDDGLGFLIRDGGAANLQDAAYRFCRYEPGVDVVLSGTGRVGHLERNAASVSGPPLQPEVVARLREIFARVSDVSGN